MKKYKLEIIMFILGAIYMILELICSRVLAPFFGTSNLVWTSVIGMILLSSSIGNYIGGIIADKDASKKNIQIILLIIGISILLIALFQENIISYIDLVVDNIKVGAIISTIVLFFIPSMFIGFLSPIIIKLKLQKLEEVGKNSGRLYSLSTLGSIVGTFLGGFILIPNWRSVQILFILSICVLLLLISIDMKRKWTTIFATVLIIANIALFYINMNINNTNKDMVLEGKYGVYADYDTQYGRVHIYNYYNDGEPYRVLNINKGYESGTYISEEKCNELVFDYTKFYDLMFEGNIDINNVLMIGGAGYSYPKYYISSYQDKNMDVVEIDGDITKIAKEYFYLDKLYKDYDLKNSKRLNIITEDGRIYLNKTTKKYDAILNDAFSGETPASTLTTQESVIQIYNALNENGMYLTNIISSLDGENSKFLKSELKTLLNVFKNVYVIPCSDKENHILTQNNMVIATDSELNFDGAVNVVVDDEAILLTDNYCPIDTLIP